MMTDSELVTNAKKGNEKALNELLNRYQKTIFGYLRKMLSNHHDAEEATQETFVNAVKGLKRYEERGNFKSRLFRIAYSEGLRCSRNRKHIAFPASSDSGQNDILGKIPDRGQIPAEHLASTEKVRHIEEAIDRLPENEKNVIFLRAYSGLPFKEIATILDCPMNTALGRMRNGTARLKQELSKENILNL